MNRMSLSTAYSRLCTPCPAPWRGLQDEKSCSRPLFRRSVRLSTGSSPIVRSISSSSHSPRYTNRRIWRLIDAVFFASKCGVARNSTTTLELIVDDEETDSRCRSVGAAVQFAKSNNLLGVMLNSKLLVCVAPPFRQPPS